MSEKLCYNKNLFLFDGFSIPVCHIMRYKQNRTFGEHGTVGYCAAKNDLPKEYNMIASAFLAGKSGFTAYHLLQNCNLKSLHL